MKNAEGYVDRWVEYIQVGIDLLLCLALGLIGLMCMPLWLPLMGTGWLCKRLWPKLYKSLTRDFLV